MLPSFNYDLPTGQERGVFLALEVGGSNLRVAVVELGGRKEEEGKGHDHDDEHEYEHEQGRRLRGQSAMMRILHMKTSPIGVEVKGRAGRGFFDWMAERVGEILLLHHLHHLHQQDEEMEKEKKAAVPLHVGVAWSFPIEYATPITIVW